MHDRLLQRQLLSVFWCTCCDLIGDVLQQFPSRPFKCCISTQIKVLHCSRSWCSEAEDGYVCYNELPIPQDTVMTIALACKHITSLRKARKPLSSAEDLCVGSVEQTSSRNSAIDSAVQLQI